MKIEYHSHVCLLNTKKMVEGWLHLVLRLETIQLRPNLSASAVGSADNLLHIRFINLTGGAI